MNAKPIKINYFLLYITNIIVQIIILFDLAPIYFLLAVNISDYTYYPPVHPNSLLVYRLRGLTLNVDQI